VREMARRLARQSIAAFALSFLLVGSARGHSWYTGLKSPLGGACCGNRDCGPVSPGLVRREPDESISIWHAGKWYTVTPDNLVSLASPDGRVHACFWKPAGGPMRMICVFLPGED
jgi:hypothetical protein